MSKDRPIRPKNHSIEIENLKYKRWFIGNLTLLTKEDNNQLSDSPMDIKLPVYDTYKEKLEVSKLFHAAFKENNQIWNDTAIDILQSKYGKELEKIFNVPSE